MVIELTIKNFIKLPWVTPYVTPCILNFTLRSDASIKSPWGFGKTQGESGFDCVDYPTFGKSINWALGDVGVVGLVHELIRQGGEEA